MDTNQKLFQFIQKSPTCYQVCENLEKELEKAGYEKLSLQEKWNVKRGGKYYLTRNDAAIVAVSIPQKTAKGFHIIASHGDSPSFKLKENPEVKGKELYTTLNTEKYGGMLMAPWFDRPLSLAGRVIYEKDGEVCRKNVQMDRDLLSIVNLAIHMNRDANKGMEYKVAKDLMPIFAGKDNNVTVKELLAKETEIPEENILDMDLFLYNRMEGGIWGANEEFISAPRLDDLQSVYSSKEAFLSRESENYMNVLAVFDNEEVGSRSIQGAASTLLPNALKRISDALGQSMEEYERMLSESFMLSADNAHAFHPNYPEKNDQTNQIYPNGGVVLKYAANQQYTTDGASAGVVKMLCKKAEVPYQTFFNHSDFPGGSTLGNIALQQLSIHTADIGAAQLAMHSPYEMAGSKDTEYMVRLMSEFYKM